MNDDAKPMGTESEAPDDHRRRRASILAIMEDRTLSPTAQRRSIQELMDGRRRNSMVASINPQQCTIVPSTAVATPRRASISRSVSNGVMGDTSVSSRRSSMASQMSTCTSMGEGDDLFLTQRTGQCLHLAYNWRGEASGDPKQMEQNRPICTHNYERNCTIISPCCGMAFGCRLCHDECDALPPPFMNKLDVQEEKSMQCRSKSMSSVDTCDETHHLIDRFAIKEIICRKCFTRQSSKCNKCTNCGVQFGEYHCSTCNLWMSNKDQPYHCKDCGFCRVGGEHNFRHCMQCGMCISKEYFATHKCTSRYKASCPCCLENLFSSREACHEMPCGHAIHIHCFEQIFTNGDTRCPLCKKTAAPHEDMKEYWESIAHCIASQPVPPEHEKKVEIYCNDCEERTANLPWHYLGIQCPKCTSFNTTEVSL